jgi:uncharacterized protein (DUF302 family)
MIFTRRVDVDLPYDQAISATKAALQEQGFGTLTEIDVRQTLEDKLDVDVEPEVIIGACNPQLAHRAMCVDPRVATLLPCNVVVRVDGGCTVVEALDPAMMAELSVCRSWRTWRMRRHDASSWPSTPWRDRDVRRRSVPGVRNEEPRTRQRIGFATLRRVQDGTSLARRGRRR